MRHRTCGRGVFLWALATAGPLLAAQPATNPAPPRAKVLKLRVASYNIEGGRKAAEVLANIRSVNPDILLLQEVDARTVRDFARAFGKRRQFGPYRPNAGQGIAILADGPMEPVKLFSMPNERNFAMAAKVKIADQELVVICAHFKSLPRPLVQGFLKTVAPHQAQAKQIVELAKKEKSPILFGGDLNTLAFTPAFITLSSTFRDTGAAVGTASQPSIFVHGVGYRIDHIMTRGPWKTLAAKVSPRPGSDHRLIWADLQLTIK